MSAPASLDPQARALLDDLAAGPQIDFDSVPPALLRAGFAALRPDLPVVALAEVRDLALPGPAGDIPIRLYKPEPGVLPCLVYLHGGGFVIGDLTSHDALCRELARAAGCAVVAVDYRLAPEHPFPAAPEDAHAATRGVFARAAELGVDPERLAVGGDSAGGCLAAAVTLLARERGGPPLRHQLLCYPVTDQRFDTASYRENADGYFLTRAHMEWFWRQYLGGGVDGADPIASPLRAPSHAKLPSATVITAGFDPLRDEGAAYAQRLADANVPVEHLHYPTQIHGFLSFAHRIDEASHALTAAAARLRTALA